MELTVATQPSIPQTVVHTSVHASLDLGGGDPEPALPLSGSPASEERGGAKFEVTPVQASSG